MRTSSASVAGLALAAGAGTALAQTEWTAADAPTEETLFDVTRTSQGPFAVGAGGVATLRRSDGWNVVLERGPTVESNPLNAVDATDDGEHAWFAGGSGVVGQYDVEDAQLTDYSAPMEMTSSWEGIAVTGEAGEETVHLVNGSGEYLSGTKTDDGGMDWGEVVEPGGGSSAFGIDFLDSETGYVADTAGQVYETTDDGDSWETIGIDTADEGLLDVVAVATDDLTVAAEGGVIYQYDGEEWTENDVGEEPVQSVDRDGETGLAAGGEGFVYDYDGEEWEQLESPTENTLYGVALDATGDYPDAAVGEGGTVIERGEYTADDDAEAIETGEWTSIESPVEETLAGVVHSSRGPYAVGAGGVVLTRRADGWETVLERGPTVESNPLNDAAVTDDGEHVWFAGGSGVVGRYDVEEYVLTDFSAPMEMTSTWEGIAVTGEAGEETVHLVNGSGEYLSGTVTDDGGVEWGEVVEPGGGSSAFGIDFLDSETGYIADTNSQVYETTDGGESWETIGVDGGSVALYDVIARARDEIYAGGGDGTVFRYNGAVWTKLWAGSNELLGIDATEDEAAASGAEGTIYERTARGWQPAETDVEETLEDLSLDDSDEYPHVAVGADGTVVERGEYEADSVEDDEEPAPWAEVDSPIPETLHDATHAEDGYAVGNEGYVLERDAGEWTVAVDDGPTGEGNVLNGVAATDDGGTVWVAGGSGAIGEYDVESDELTDRSAPDGRTSTWEAIDVTGEAGDETIHLINGSGEYLSGTKTGDGEVDWDDVVEPGGGSSALGIDFLDSETGYVCDTTSQVYETTDGGDSWETIGIDNASAGLTDVVAEETDAILVSADDGTVFQYDGAVWTKRWAGGTELLAADAVEDAAATAGSEGTIYERTPRDWQQAETDVETDLRGVSLAEGDEDELARGIAVGTDGIILERGDPDEDEEDETDEDETDDGADDGTPGFGPIAAITGGGAGAYLYARSKLGGGSSESTETELSSVSSESADEAHAGDDGTASERSVDERNEK
ncbi:Uncharacterized protein SAMN04515672_3243 [Natronorubrum texcoconense]|uniref:Photosynthesis system II assembly factor Ycf48/Hcf136-like domain-containing protein n=2 Tax=Natronorubrum texcoconense TaxID=1095776 RepID=A0A1G9C743_9EURY|nr:Uncharacterized protein SAMN04515672_3243 [Natronorubrum texcoconense]